MEDAFQLTGGGECEVEGVNEIKEEENVGSTGRIRLLPVLP